MILTEEQTTLCYSSTWTQSSAPCAHNYRTFIYRRGMHDPSVPVMTELEGLPSSEVAFESKYK